MHIEAVIAAVNCVLLAITVSSQVCDSTVQGRWMADLDCEPGVGAPDLVWKASGMRLERSSGGETVVEKGCAGLGGVGRSGTRPFFPVDELRRPAKRQLPPRSLVNTCMIVMFACTRRSGQHSKVDHTNHIDLQGYF